MYVFFVECGRHPYALVLETHEGPPLDPYYDNFSDRLRTNVGLLTKRSSLILLVEEELDPVSKVQSVIHGGAQALARASAATNRGSASRST